ncbi:MAG: helix-turn-helix domain-containing protein [Yoonia sp.]
MSGTIRSSGQKALCKELIVLRKAAGLTQTDLADRLHCHQSLIARIESGERRIDVIELIVIARAIGCRPEEILHEIDKVVEPTHRL